jgi:hypothetical protein
MRVRTGRFEKLRLRDQPGDTHLVEILAPERSFLCAAVGSSSLRFPVEASPLFASDSSSSLVI